MSDVSLNLPISRKQSTVDQSGVPADKASRILVVVLHGILGSHRQIGAVAQLARTDLPEAEIWMPLMPHRGFLGTFSTISAEGLVRKLVEDLDAIWERGNYHSIRFIGHSMGGLLSRAMLLAAREMRKTNARGVETGSTQQTNRHWSEFAVDSDDRLILLAAINKGTGPTYNMGPFKALGVALGVAVGRLLQSIGINQTLLAICRGSQFLTDLRLAWIEESHQHPMPTTIQLLGSVDDIVGPDDSLDLVSGSSFRYIDVNNTSHMSILDVGSNNLDGADLSGLPPKQAIQAHRRDMIRLALLTKIDAPEFLSHETRPWGLAQSDEAELRRREAITDVLFVVHGIRDKGHWTDKIARRVWKMAGPDRQHKIERMVDSYGYLGAGPFLFPQTRRKKVNWFMERYIKARALYPKAAFHFVGHSHGTYVLASALETHDRCRFDNIVFAGSIVRSSYDWMKRITQTGQAKKLLNIVATNDWVVALFPRFFDFYNLQDIGGAGHAGFTQASDSGPIYTMRYAKGDHGAGTTETFWTTIASFILTGTYEAPQIDVVARKKLRSFQVGGLWSAAVWGLSWLNFLVWSAVASLLLVVVPTLIVAAIHSQWPAISALSVNLFAEESRAFTLAGASIVMVLIYLGVARGQQRYERPWRSLRNIIGIPIMAACALIVAAAFLAMTQFGLLPTLASMEKAELIAATAAVCVWFAALSWALKRA